MKTATIDDFIEKSIIETRIMATHSSNRPGLIEGMLPEESTKNVCVKLSKPHAVYLEAACRLVALNKQEFLTVMVSDALSRVWERFDAEGMDVDAYLKGALEDEGYTFNEDGSITLGGE